MKSIINKYIILLILSLLINNGYIYSNTFEIYKKQYESGNKNDAIKGFKDIIRKNPRHENIADMEFILAENEKDYMKSITAFQEIYRKRKNFSRRDEVGYIIGSLYILQNGFLSAVNIFNDVKKDYPNSKYNKLSSLKIASINLKLNNIDNAIKEYKEIVELDSNKKTEVYYEALFGLANSYFAKEQYYQALGTYNKLIKENEAFNERAFALYRVGLCYEYTDKKTNAIDIYNMIVSVYPNTQSKTLAMQRLRLHNIQKDNNEPQKTKNKKLEAPTIYQTNKQNIYQMGRFRDRAKSDKMLAIISELGYNAYVIEEDSTFIVRLNIYDDKRNIEEMRKRFNKENIPFFKIK